MGLHEKTCASVPSTLSLHSNQFNLIATICGTKFCHALRFSHGFSFLLILSLQLSEAAHARLRKAQSRRRINKDTKSALAKWLKQLQFKMALAEQSPDGSLFI